MSDEPINGDQHYRERIEGYERDLRLAEHGMIAKGRADVANEMHDHAAAIRNYMQGAIVPMFVEMVERVLDRKLQPVSDQIGGLESTLQAEFHDGLLGIQGTVSTLVETVDHLQADMKEGIMDRQALHAELGVVRGELDAMHARVAILERDRGDYTDEERASMIETLLRLLEWWKATYEPDGH